MRSLRALFSSDYRDCVNRNIMVTHFLILTYISKVFVLPEIVELLKEDILKVETTLTYRLLTDIIEYRSHPCKVLGHRARWKLW